MKWSAVAKGFKNTVLEEHTASICKAKAQQNWQTALHATLQVISVIMFDYWIISS
jgi:hypothetical protein